MEFSIPESMNANDVTRFIAQLKALTNAEIKKKAIIVLDTQDEKAIKIMQILLGVEESEPRKKKSAMLESDTSKSYEVLSDNGEVMEELSIEEKNMRLAEGKFIDATRLRYIKNGKLFTVTGTSGKPQKMLG